MTEKDGIIQDLNFEISGVREKLHLLKEVSDTPDEVEAMDGVVMQYMELLYEPLEGEGVRRQLLVNAAVELAYQVMKNGIE